MENNFQKMIDRAVEIRNKYDEKDIKKWDVEQVFMGMIKDIGNLSKILMVYNGYRKDLNKNTNEALGHELSDILYSIFIIADKTGVDLKMSFWQVMDKLERRIENK